MDKRGRRMMHTTQQMGLTWLSIVVVGFVVVLTSAVVYSSVRAAEPGSETVTLNTLLTVLDRIETRIDVLDKKVDMLLSRGAVTGTTTNILPPPPKPPEPPKPPKPPEPPQPPEPPKPPKPKPPKQK